MVSIKKHIQKVVVLMLTWLLFAVQAKAQFFEDDGDPGGFDPPPDNDVPLDTYQWIMMLLAIGYGIYIFWKHYQKNRQVKNGGMILPSLKANAQTS